MTGKDVLVVTLPPYAGGVPAKTRILCQHLSRLGHRVTVAWYATFAHQAHVNVPSWHCLSTRRPGVVAEPAFSNYPGHAVGCWLPELEAPYYRLSPRWQTLIDGHDRHIAVGGPPMVANILARAGIPHFLWCASEVMADRRDRQRQMSWPRALVDRMITRPWLLAQQRFIMANTPKILGVSRYTVEQLTAIGAVPARLARMPIPVDCATFTPASQSPQTPVIGFAARFEDPRKNLSLLLDAMALLRHRHPTAKLRLAGCQPSAATLAHIDRTGLANAVEFVGVLPSTDLPAFYRSLSVFALPSYQEGLCLAALEAMACGVPVVSTDCGGPADFVHDGKTGFLVRGWHPHNMAAALEQALEQQAELAAGARALVLAEFSPEAFAATIAETWRQVWGEAP